MARNMTDDLAAQMVREICDAELNGDDGVAIARRYMEKAVEDRA